MNINMIRKSLLSKKYSKPMFLILLCLILIYYFILFFSPGITFWGVFLKKETSSSERIYTGHTDSENDVNDDYIDDIIITVQGKVNQDPSANVIFQLSNDEYEYYTVVFQEKNHWDAGIVLITDIDENILFEGNYEKESDTFFNKNGRQYFINNHMAEGNIDKVSQNRSMVERIVDVVYETDYRIRGETRYLILAIILFIITGIDYCFPLFFFRLSYELAVYNPEPSEFYEFCQKVSWVVMIILGIILMIKAI